MKRNITAIAILLFILASCSSIVTAQFNINIPKIDIPKIKVDLPEKNAPKTKDVNSTGKDGSSTGNGKTKLTGGAGPIYKIQRPTDVPVLLKNSIYVQARTHNGYWKMPNQENYSSWVPVISFDQFYNNDKRINYTVEYFNPDGSLWYSEKLDQSDRKAADRTVRFESPNPYEVLNTKSTVGTGAYTFKITNQDNGQVLYQGKFKVGKLSRSDNPREKNKLDFYVEHDWLLPFGMIGFHHSLDEVGATMPLVSVWLKGQIDTNDLEGRVFYKGQQIASTRDGDGSSGVGDYDERATDFTAAFAPQSHWKRWQFQWGNFRVDNNGTFNRADFPKAFYVDKNPGDYTVKIYRSGSEIRELGFSVGTDGRFVEPAYTNQIFMPYYRFLVPVKIIGAAEKWDANAWKTDAFYGNPLSGFSIQ